ncbi:hypothetical protein Dsin_009132 [Dipteronia sinensis]|uniref:Reverse transcriptase domain-containing protein n=1 Tax=Dipteronia sinensis TaxID=43782 RepID=A0AAE0AQE5_9ROSI|nr:hypothetical protein Dsin_009132 [Dipteronia sinensis]
MKFRQPYKEGGLLVKLDFEKAYDSVDHTFLDSLLEGMGFGCKWRQWMSSCISSPMFSVFVNGSPTQQFSLQRCLCQGDPLSPFLFNIVIKPLNRMFQKAFNLEMLRGVVFGYNEVHVSHPQFTYDTILFIERKIEFIFNSKRIFHCFEIVSGLRINFYKSCIVKLGKKGNMEEEWVAAFRCKHSSFPISYQGLPLGANVGTKGFGTLVVEKNRETLGSLEDEVLIEGW